MSGIQMMSFGGMRIAITHTNESIYDAQFGGPAAVTYQLKTDGTACYSTISSGSGVYGNYCDPANAAAFLEVSVAVTGFAVTGSATGTYLPLSVIREWTLTQSGAGTKSSSLAVTIREVANPTNTLTRTVQLDVEAP